MPRKHKEDATTSWRGKCEKEGDGLEKFTKKERIEGQEGEVEEEKEEEGEQEEEEE